jgi:hypothetical protein
LTLTLESFLSGRHPPRLEFGSAKWLTNYPFNIAKMKFTVLAALLSSAAAFAPAKSAARTSAVQMGYENELGVIAPTGFFDPLGLSSNIDQETFDAYRTAELKVRAFLVLAQI